MCTLAASISRLEKSDAVADRNRSRNGFRLDLQRIARKSSPKVHL